LPPRCPDGSLANAYGACPTPITSTCGPNMTPFGNFCLPIATPTCARGTTAVRTAGGGFQCLPSGVVTCLNGHLADGKCVQDPPPCGAGMMRIAGGGCGPIVVTQPNCGPFATNVGGRCTPIHTGGETGGSGGVVVGTTGGTNNPTGGSTGGTLPPRGTGDGPKGSGGTTTGTGGTDGGREQSAERPRQQPLPEVRGLLRPPPSVLTRRQHRKHRKNRNRRHRRHRRPIQRDWREHSDPPDPDRGIHAVAAAQQFQAVLRDRTRRRRPECVQGQRTHRRLVRRKDDEPAAQ
jgi:hypothetical protein